MNIEELPDEILMMICDKMDNETLCTFYGTVGHRLRPVVGCVISARRLILQDIIIESSGNKTRSKGRGNVFAGRESRKTAFGDLYNRKVRNYTSPYR